jgi:pentatricopeptide repeat protein
VEHGYGEEALRSYEEMYAKKAVPDSVTIICGLRACSAIGSIEKGVEIHAEIERRSLLEANIAMGSALVGMYIKCGSLSRAQAVFEGLHVRDVVSWTALIDGYTDHGYGEAALQRYDQMRLQGVMPNVVTFIGALRACSSIGAIEKGQAIHSELERKGLIEQNPLIGSALVDMYAKCGSTGMAQQVFEKLGDRDIVSWNSLIAGYAQLGAAQRFVHVVERMLGEGVRPDSITLLLLLCACGRSGMLASGQTYLEVMSRSYGICVTAEHQSCMVHLLGLAGNLEQAMAVMKRAMAFSPALPAWRAILGACKNHGSSQLASQAFEHALHLDKTHSASYVLMSQIHGQE